MNRILKAFRHPDRALLYILGKKVGHIFSDKAFIKMTFYLSTGYKLNLKDPKNFNEKINWLKLYDFKPEYTQMVDKIACRSIVSERIGEQYVVPMIAGPWSRIEEIDFDALPNRFVLKCNHDCGSVIVCKDKTRFNKDEAILKLKKHMKRKYFYQSREKPYKDIVPRIFAEQYLENPDKDVLVVYKVFNFNGVPRIIQTIQNDKTPNETIDYFDENWNLLDLRQDYENSEHPMPRPRCLEEMLRLSKTLSEGYPFLRTDFYEVEGKLYFSEYTFYTDAGMKNSGRRNGIGFWASGSGCKRSVK